MEVFAVQTASMHAETRRAPGPSPGRGAHSPPARLAPQPAHEGAGFLGSRPRRCSMEAGRCRRGSGASPSRPQPRHL